MAQRRAKKATRKQAKKATRKPAKAATRKAAKATRKPAKKAARKAPNAKTTKRAAAKPAAKKRAAKKQGAKKQAAKKQAARRPAGKKQAAKKQGAKKQVAKKQAGKARAATKRSTGAESAPVMLPPAAVVEAVLEAAGWGYEKVEGDDAGWHTYVTRVQDGGPLSAFVTRVSEPLQRFLLYAMFGLEVSEERRAAVSELTTRANWGLGDGNFEMDYETGELRFKIGVDFTDLPLSPMQVRNAMVCAMDTVEIYAGALLRVLEGEATPSQAIAEAEAAVTVEADA